MNARTEFSLGSLEHPGLRRAALALYATERHDQAWLLAQLPEDHRPALDKMLADLAALGLPRDRAMVEALLRHSPVPPPAATSPPVVEDGGLAHFRSAPAGDLAAVLEPEPAGLVAHAIALLPVSGRPGVLELLSAPKRRQVQELLRRNHGDSSAGHAGEVAPRLTRALLTAVVPRLPRHPAAPNLWRRLSGQVKSAWALKAAS